MRIATNKIEAAKQKLADLRRTDPLPRDSRVFPGVYAPVMIWEDGRRVIKPMRYFCRLPGWTETIERKFPGTYNARRDKLESSWKGLFGVQHGIMVADVFYENVEGPNGENQVLAFTPRDREPMLIACLWNRSPGYKGAPDLYSFAAITDEPEPEVAEAGHDRTIINIKPEHVDAWLRPDAGNLAALYAIFDDKRHPYLHALEKGEPGPLWRGRSVAKDKLWELELWSILNRHGIPADLLEPDILATTPIGPIAIACKRTGCMIANAHSNQEEEAEEVKLPPLQLRHGSRGRCPVRAPQRDDATLGHVNVAGVEFWQGQFN